MKLYLVMKSTQVLVVIIEYKLLFICYMMQNPSKLYTFALPLLPLLKVTCLILNHFYLLFHAHDNKNDVTGVWDEFCAAWPRL